MKQGRFAHFINDDIDYFQAKIDEMWTKWLIRACSRFRRRVERTAAGVDRGQQPGQLHRGTWLRDPGARGDDGGDRRLSPVSEHLWRGGSLYVSRVSTVKGGERERDG